MGQVCFSGPQDWGGGGASVNSGVEAAEERAERATEREREKSRGWSDT